MDCIDTISKTFIFWIILKCFQLNRTKSISEFSTQGTLDKSTSCLVMVSEP